MATVSTIIPAFNAERFIAQAIDSALAQGVSQQIIVVDDGSTDATAKIVAGYGNRVELICQPNAGVSAARNSGIAAAAGDFVAFLDADDVWLPGKLQAQLDLFAADPALGTVICDEMHVTVAGEVVRPSFLATRKCYSQLPKQPARLTKPMTWLVRESFFPTSGVITRREVLHRAGSFDMSLSICEDRDFWIKLAMHGPVGLVPQVLLRYLTGRMDSLSVSTSQQRWATALEHVLRRHSHTLKKLVRDEGEDPQALFGQVYCELAEIFWYSDRMEDAARLYALALSCGRYRCFPKWLAARSGTDKLARRLYSLFK